jgi:hypothetical protein
MQKITSCGWGFFVEKTSSIEYGNLSGFHQYQYFFNS